ncbi:hypothetical protein, partial [Bartonella raoultii]|uniref:hypothetical protein n=1 Tax=Bartonella raoultii TaxID=1457020 RepID=UPI001ABB6762
SYIQKQGQNQPSQAEAALVNDRYIEPFPQKSQYHFLKKMRFYLFLYPPTSRTLNKVLPGKN